MSQALPGACSGCGDEGARDLRHGLGGSELFAAVLAKKVGDAPFDVQAWLNDVEIQAVDTLDGKRHVVLDDIGNGSGYTHDAGSGRQGLSTTAACRHNSVQVAITPDRSRIAPSPNKSAAVHRRG